MVFVPADKAANNIVAVCKHYYVAYLAKELESSGVYEVCEETQEVILQRLNAALGSRKMKAVEKWAYLYWMPKQHKEGARFIAGGRECVTTQTSKLLVGILNAVLASLREEMMLLSAPVGSNGSLWWMATRK